MADTALADLDQGLAHPLGLSEGEYKSESDIGDYLMIKIHLVSPIDTVVSALAIALVRTPTSVWFSIARHLTQVWVVARRQPMESLV